MRRLLASCDRRRARGRRDYAIVVLLSRLGLRAGEVAALELDDIDWRAGQILVRGKGNRDERLPLPDDVGAAIAGYLRRGRPGTARVCAGQGPASGVDHGRGVDGGPRRRPACRAGTVHAHRLRHTAATTMLRSGTPLPEVGLVLRQRRALTTAMYAKVDRDALRVLARPWPRPTIGGAS